MRKTLICLAILACMISAGNVHQKLYFNKINLIDGPGNELWG